MARYLSSRAAVAVIALVVLAVASTSDAQTMPAMGFVYLKSGARTAASAKLTPVKFENGQWVPVAKIGQQASFGAKAAANSCPLCDNKKQLSAVKTSDRTKFPYASVALVELVLNHGYMGKCTGTLIAPDRVLTAGHCVTHEANTMTSGTVKFGAFGSSFTDSANIASAFFFKDWSDKGLYRADVAVLYLDRNLTKVPVAKYGPASSVAKGNSPRQITTLGYPHFEGDSFESNNFRYASTTTAGYKVSANNQQLCGSSDADGVYMFKLPIGSGMSGGPLFDVASKTVVATNDLACTQTGCSFDMACVRGYTPVSDYYSIKQLASQKP